MCPHIVFVFLRYMYLETYNQRDKFSPIFDARVLDINLNPVWAVPAGAQILCISSNGTYSCARAPTDYKGTCNFLI